MQSLVRFMAVVAMSERLLVALRNILTPSIDVFN